ncbi:MAG: malonyl-ACP O-methyltransferase BioC [Desulfobulbaceae bacterium]|nr:malonyl-ACP O-methyltransferase BioC [Desulfobulbaceae bacterium]
MIPDKKLIKLRFEQAAATYEQQAKVQHLVADRLLVLLTEAAPAVTPVHVLEIGCCTGLLTEKILDLFPDVSHLTVSDLVAAFEQCVCRKIGRRASHITFLAGDIESVDLPTKYDLIISSSTLHWVHDLSNLFRKLHAHLNPGGILAFSQYGVDNLREIRAVTGVGLQYKELEQLQAVVMEKFDILAAEENRETLWFPDPISVLQHLRSTGVNSIGQQVWTRKQVNSFISDYTHRFTGEQGVCLTYHPIFIIARPQF